MGHWLLKDVYHAFVVENINTWDPHPINITHQETVEKTYTSLADSERGSQIAEHFNTIVTQFPVRSKHKETIQILSNFINNALLKVSNEGRVGTNLIYT